MEAENNLLMEKLPILIVDDEEKIVDLIKLYLEKEGYDPIVAKNGLEGLNLFKRYRPALVILDLMLPAIDGLEVLRRIREHSSAPVIILTARGEETDRVIGLSLGADDYVAKPFSPRELVARVKAVLRRTRQWPDISAEEIGDENLKINLATREVKLGEEIIKLTSLEFDLLAALLRYPGRVFTRQQLIDAVWGVDYVGDPRVVDVHIANVRKKLGSDPQVANRIVTVRDVGYKYENSAVLSP